MATKNISNYCISMTFLMLLMLIGRTKSDIAKDREECVEQLIGLSVCLPYVGGESKAPTLDCCSNLRIVVQKSKKCLCILVKDRDDPELGLKINATLALNLPTLCHAPSNVSECPGLLHIPLNSPDAKIFLEFANMTRTSPASISGKGSSGGSAPSAKSDASQIRQIQRLGMEVICGVLIWFFASYVLYTV